MGGSLSERMVLVAEEVVWVSEGRVRSSEGKEMIYI